MTLHIVRLATPRSQDEGVRIGTVRRPPRGVPKSRYAKDNYYDVWLPDLSPSAELFKVVRSIPWNTFVRRFRREMNQPGPRRLLDIFAALSHSADFSIGCYCEEEWHCHRSVLRELLAERGAKLA
jgi:uncharacterized protein YeaO (DUF488 family)